MAQTHSNRGQVVAVLGAQWGDEGKGKLVDILAADMDICARCNGGANAGHTLVVEGQSFAMHLLPCGVLHPHTQNLLGNGVVIHMKTLFEEIETIKERDPAVQKRIFVSSRAHLVFDVHQRIDCLQEDAKQQRKAAIGTTRRGIGPCYACKSSRQGLRVADLLRWSTFKNKYRVLMSDYRTRYGDALDFGEKEEDEELSRHKVYAEELKGQVLDSVLYLNTAVKEGKRILVEGANATMLDIEHGTYPYVTSCVTSIGGLCSGLGMPPRFLTSTVGVVKAYCTRVGLGYFPTELTDNDGEHMQIKGQEFGTTTGRKRRCGWLDLAMLSYVQIVNGFSELNITKLDVLTGLEEVNVCVGYKEIATGKLLPEGFFPCSEEENNEMEPQYERLKGWQQSLQDCTAYKDLPQEARAYIEKIASFVGVRIGWVGVGPGRSQMLKVP